MSSRARSASAARRKSGSIRRFARPSSDCWRPQVARVPAPTRHCRRWHRIPGGWPRWSRHRKSRQAWRSYRVSVSSRATFVAEGFPFRPVKGAELQVLGALADAAQGGMGLCTIEAGFAGTRRATSLPWRVMVISSPRSTQSSNWPNLFFASKAPISRIMVFQSSLI